MSIPKQMDLCMDQTYSRYYKWRTHLTGVESETDFLGLSS
jgi:hypothetical protein